MLEYNVVSKACFASEIVEEWLSWASITCKDTCVTSPYKQTPKNFAEADGGTVYMPAEEP